MSLPRQHKLAARQPPTRCHPKVAAARRHHIMPTRGAMTCTEHAVRAAHSAARAAPHLKFGGVHHIQQLLEADGGGTEVLPHKLLGHGAPHLAKKGGTFSFSFFLLHLLLHHFFYTHPAHMALTGGRHAACPSRLRVAPAQHNRRRALLLRCGRLHGVCVVHGTGLPVRCACWALFWHC